MKINWWEKWRKVDAWFESRGMRAVVVLACACVFFTFFAALSQFYIPGKGFTYLIGFSGEKDAARLSKLRQLDFYVERSSGGYDAQYYAQIAMDPSLKNKELRKAVDSLPYRARRILLSAVAHVLGFGKPAAILQVYSLLNVVAWLALATLLWNWFPANSWENFFRWLGVLFSFGLCASLRNSLIDGPSLLLVATGVYFLEKGRPWLSTCALALGGLCKETNLLGAATLLPKKGEGLKAWRTAVVRGVLVALPLALWLVYISRTVGAAADVGYRNFDFPLFAYFRKAQTVIAALKEMNMVDLGPLWSLCMLLALTVQLIFIVARPRWNDAWWRVGASFALLMIFLGDAVWEGYPGAASRVLLPMQLAFNVLVPRGRGWSVVLLLGNLTLFSAPAALESPRGDGYQIEGAGQLLYGSGGDEMQIEFSEAWYATERLNNDYWCWSTGSGQLFVHNPHDRALIARMRFSLAVAGRRSVTVQVDGEDQWQTTQSESSQVSAIIDNITLLPGITQIDFITDEPGRRIGGDPRELAFRLTNLRLHLHRFVDDAAKK